MKHHCGPAALILAAAILLSGIISSTAKAAPAPSATGKEMDLLFPHGKVSGVYYQGLRLFCFCLVNQGLNLREAAYCNGLAVFHGKKALQVGRGAAYAGETGL